MPKRLKATIQYLLIIAVTVFLVWISLGVLKVEEGTNKWEYILETWHRADKIWLIIMAGVTILSHILRAERWRMLVKSTGHHTSLSNSFFSTMVGYLVNLVIPRGGEVSKCYNLYKLDKIPVEISFGTVVIERLVDVLCLLALTFFAFLIESEKLFRFIETLPVHTENTTTKIFTILIFILIIALATLLLYRIARKNLRFQTFLNKLWTGFREGLISIIKLEQKGLFIFYSITIWLMYFAMSYLVILAFEETSQLGFSAVLTLFAIGSIAMAIPLPGGAGSYHTMLPAGLIYLYTVPRAEAVAFTFVFHGWQTLIMIVGGVFSLLSTYILVKRRPSS